MSAPDRLPFVKGHGTQNDFVLLPDRDNRIELTASLAAALADRRSGIGGDGVIRVGRDEHGWVMDYRNADGSPAEMCGNGARVFARFLVDAGWAPAGRLEFATRGGPRVAELGTSGDVLVHLGPVRVGPATTIGLGSDEIPAVAVDVGNPHAVARLAGDVGAIDLVVAPCYDRTLFPDGANVELITVIDPDHIRMRVYERGVGETRSCGTGTVAAAAALLHSQGLSIGTVDVAVPGGAVRVEVLSDDSTLTGPAALVAAGEIRLSDIALAQPLG